MPSKIAGDMGGGLVGDRIDIFNPTPPQAQHLLDLLQRADCSIDDIAQALRTSVAALTVYLASDDAIEILAQAELANARRGRLAATAQLDKCAHALSLILDGYISDTTTAVRRDTPKNRREDLIHQESARRAAAQLFKIANFTPRIFTSQLNTNPTRKRGVTHAPNTTAATPTPTASSARLLAPRERGEVAESARPVRGRDVNELQPASIDAQPSESSVALNSPSPREGAGGGFSASEHSSTYPSAASPPHLLAPRQRGEDRFAVGEAGEGTRASERQAATIPAATDEARDASHSPSPVGVMDGPRPWSVTAVTRGRTGPAPPAVS
jgi:hypothetical protein